MNPVSARFTAVRDGWIYTVGQAGEWTEAGRRAQENSRPVCGAQNPEAGGVARHLSTLMAGERPPTGPAASSHAGASPSISQEAHR